jgi:hypothetical protein
VYVVTGIFSEFVLNSLQIPHAFQQKLSAEKAPTLSMALLSYERMISAWKALQVKYPHMCCAVQAGIDKLETYEERLQLSDAYILARCRLYLTMKGIC